MAGKAGTMSMDGPAILLFIASAVALLGSPGPAIAALIVVGRAHGWAGGLRYYTGLQVGLAIGAGATAAGLFSLLRIFPYALRTMTVAAAIYLLYLAYQIATSPIGSTPMGKQTSPSPTAGFLLAITNPKAYVAFASLMASQRLFRNHPQDDLVLKWTLCVAVMLVVDLAWLFAGVALQQVSLRRRTERLLNVGLGATILFAAIFTLV